MQLFDGEDQIPVFTPDDVATIECERAELLGQGICCAADGVADGCSRLYQQGTSKNTKNTKN